MNGMEKHISGLLLQHIFSICFQQEFILYRQRTKTKRSIGLAWFWINPHWHRMIWINRTVGKDLFDVCTLLTAQIDFSSFRLQLGWHFVMRAPSYHLFEHTTPYPCTMNTTPLRPTITTLHFPSKCGCRLKLFSDIHLEGLTNLYSRSTVSALPCFIASPIA